MLSVNLTSVFWQARVEEGMIIMPINNLNDDRMFARKQLIEQINSRLSYCVLPFRVSMKYISVTCTSFLNDPRNVYIRMIPVFWISKICL